MFASDLWKNLILWKEFIIYLLLLLLAHQKE